MMADDKLVIFLPNSICQLTIG